MYNLHCKKPAQLVYKESGKDHDYRYYIKYNLAVFFHRISFSFDNYSHFIFFKVKALSGSGSH